MIATATLVLPKSVQLIPMNRLPLERRRKLGGGEEDVVVTRTKGRSASTVVESRAVPFLELFRTPREIVEAVLLHSLCHGLSPKKVLDEALPMLEDLLRERILVSEADEPAEDELLYAVGDEVAGTRVVRPISAQEDVEIHQCRREDGSFAALKVARRLEVQLAGSLQAEQTILEHLSVRRSDGSADPRASCIAPRLYAGDLDAEHPYLLLEWCSGVSARTAAEALWQRREGTRGELLALCRGVADAYAELHREGVLHGDVHPGNVLVEKNHRARVVDFGLGRFIAEEPAGPQRRGGVIFYHDPEHAGSLLRGGSPPPLTPLGEQYSLAALLYLLVTGHYYTDFGLERARVLEQVLRDTPASFESLGLEPWPALEAILARGLAKEPTARFSSTAALAEALAGVGVPDAHETMPAARVTASQPSSELRRRSSDLLHQADLGGPWWTSTLPAPTASATFGAAGIAFALYRIACLNEDPHHLALADAWAEKAASEVAAPEAFYSDQLEVSERSVGRSSPYHTASGVAAVQAWIAGALGNGKRQAAAVRRFVAASTERERWDVTLGRSGILLVSAFLHDALLPEAEASATEAKSELKQLATEVQREIWDYLGGLPPISESGLENLGAAHGWAGFLYATLQWSRSTGSPVPVAVLSRLEELRELAYPAGRGLRWPWIAGEGRARFMPGWCNGSAGHVFLWTLAGRLLDRPDYLEMAVGVGWDTWETPFRPASLCCGLIGRAYALLNLYKHTGDRAWHSRAADLAEQAVRRGFYDLEAPHSLYKGQLGLAVLAADLEHPGESAMPLFEEEGWAV